MMLFLLYIFATYLCIIGIYLLAATLASLSARPPRREENPACRMLFVIPAYNEEAGIARTIRSISNDPANNIHTSVSVIADNCTDATAKAAAQAGAAVFERDDSARPGKGQALHWFLTRHAALVAEHDLVAVVDADTIVLPGFKAAMARLFADSRILAAQAFYDVANPDAGWRNRLLSAALRALHHTRPMGRTRLGGSAGLKGNGMAFRAALLNRYGWPAGSVVEDLEFSLLLACDGIRVHYAPDAVVAGDMPFSRKGATTQRVRWEGGRRLMVRAWLPRLLKAYCRRPSRLGLDAILDLATPPLSLLTGGHICLAGAALALNSRPAAWFALAMMGITAAHVLCALAQTRAPLRIWTALALAPFYILWKFSVIAAVACRRRLMWDRSPREGVHS